MVEVYQNVKKGAIRRFAGLCKDYLDFDAVSVLGGMLGSGIFYSIGSAAGAIYDLAATQAPQLLYNGKILEGLEQLYQAGQNTGAVVAPAGFALFYLGANGLKRKFDTFGGKAVIGGLVGLAVGTIAELIWRKK